MDSRSSRELNSLITRVSVAFIIYGFLLVLNINPTKAFCFFCVMLFSTLYRSKSLSFIFNKLAKTSISDEKAEIINTILSLQNYRQKTQKWNNRRRSLYYSLPGAHKKLAGQLDYLQKIDKVDEAIAENSKIIEDIADFARNKYQVELSELRIAVPAKNNFRIIESLCHYQRDWSQAGDKELEPILKYFTEGLAKIEKDDTSVKKSNTAVVIPGSGLGRLAHEIALQNYSQVHAVEYSLLMYLFNEFIYSKYDTQYTVYPHVHSYSHHINLENQLRTIILKGGISKPKNLSLHNVDFREFNIPNSEGIDNVIVVTEFFMDTAENIFEYMDSIVKLIGSKKGYWINLGPLKYGSSPKIEPTLEEWRRIRKLYSWKDIEEIDPLEDQLIGYLTDKKGLWQGNYGVGRWISKLTTQ